MTELLCKEISKYKQIKNGPPLLPTFPVTGQK